MLVGKAVGLVTGSASADYIQLYHGNPLLYRDGSKLLDVAPSKAPALTVYEIDAPQ